MTKASRAVFLAFLVGVASACSPTDLRPGTTMAIKIINDTTTSARYAKTVATLVYVQIQPYLAAPDQSRFTTQFNAALAGLDEAIDMAKLAADQATPHTRPGPLLNRELAIRSATRSVKAVLDEVRTTIADYHRGGGVPLHPVGMDDLDRAINAM